MDTWRRFPRCLAVVLSVASLAIAAGCGGVSAGRAGADAPTLVVSAGSASTEASAAADDVSITTLTVGTAPADAITLLPDVPLRLRDVEGYAGTAPGSAFIDDAALATGTFAELGDVPTPVSDSLGYTYVQFGAHVRVGHGFVHESVFIDRLPDALAATAASDAWLATVARGRSTLPPALAAGSSTAARSAPPAAGKGAGLRTWAAGKGTAGLVMCAAEETVTLCLELTAVPVAELTSATAVASRQLGAFRSRVHDVAKVQASPADVASVPVAEDCTDGTVRSGATRLFTERGGSDPPLTDWTALLDAFAVSHIAVTQAAIVCDGVSTLSVVALATFDSEQAAQAVFAARYSGGRDQALGDASAAAVAPCAIAFRRGVSIVLICNETGTDEGAAYSTVAHRIASGIDRRLAALEQGVA